LIVESRAKHRLMPKSGNQVNSRVLSTAVCLLLSTFKKGKVMAFAFEKLAVYQKAVDKRIK
jgi:hypothetical protein